ncbi:MAG TPA: hypothetical protein VGI39_00550 [Polyangiaceae bacterium]
MSVVRRGIPFAGRLSLLVAVALGVARPASAAEPSRAETLFQEARALLSAERYEEACAKLAESEALDPAVGTEFHLARCYELTGRVASAVSLYERIALETHAAGQDAREAAARERIAALAPRRSTVVVHAPGEVPGLEVTLDGAPLARGLWGAPHPVDPGPHTLRASAPGRVSRTESFQVTEGASMEVAVGELAETAAPAAARRPLSEQPPVLATGTWNAQRALALAVGGAGIGLVGAGLSFGLRSWELHGDADAQCGAGGCNPQGLWLDHQASVMGNESTVLAITGGVLLASSVVMWLTSPSKRAWGPRVGELQLNAMHGAFVAKVRF